MDITPETHVATIATRHPRTLRVFQRHGIDFCCGGKRSLVEACTAHGVDLDAMRRELDEAVAGPRDDGQSWEEAPLAALVDHIVSRFHDRLREDLPRLAAMADRVVEAHGATQPETLPALARTVHGLRAELESHMAKEEQVLFPWVCRMASVANGDADAAALPPGSVSAPIAVMEHEHDAAAAALAELRRLTDGFQPPPGACTTFRGLYHGLAELETDTHLHIHLENNVLFRRAHDLEAALAAPAVA